MNYQDFLQSKRVVVPPAGFAIDQDSLHPGLRDDQKFLTQWALMKGKAALFVDTGGGKTATQVEWCDWVHRKTDQNVLMLAPLAVAHQIVREAREMWDVDIRYVRGDSEVQKGISITNYDRLHLFDPNQFGAIDLDEASILKGDGPIRRRVSAFGARMPYRLEATATPAPNEELELISHADFLGVMSEKEAIALYFRQDGNSSHKFRLKDHAIKDFYEWGAEWFTAMRRPSDLGFTDEGFNLPELRHHIVEVSIDRPLPGELFPRVAKKLQERIAARRDSIPERVAKVVELANSFDEPVLIWCSLNPEGEALAAQIESAIEVAGRDTPEHKERVLLGFSDGSVRKLVSKPKIAGWGMNWQHCRKVIFTGLTDSWEQVYQATRRCWRYGQTQPVDVYYVVASTEGETMANISRKDAAHLLMVNRMIAAQSGRLFGTETVRQEMDYSPSRKMIVPEWARKVA